MVMEQDELIEKIKGWFRKKTVTVRILFGPDDGVGELLMQATEFKSKKDWASALAALAKAKKLMLVSSVTYPGETWCKYPLYLQWAGRFDESMAEFQFLLDDLERRARRETRLDDSDSGPKKRKMACYRIIVREGRRVIKEKMALAKTRQQKAEAKRVPR
jgi:hypothetical protein